MAKEREATTPKVKKTTLTQGRGGSAKTALTR